MRILRSRELRRRVRERRNNKNSIVERGVETEIQQMQEARGNSRINIYSTYIVFRTFNRADLAALAVAHTLSAMKTFVRGKDCTSSPLHALSSHISHRFSVSLFFLQISSNNRQHFDICKQFYV